MIAVQLSKKQIRWHITAMKVMFDALCAVDHHRAAAEVADHLANLYGAAYGAGVGENWRAIAESRRLDAEQDEAEENHHVNV